MTPAETLELEREVHNLIERLRSKRYAMERVDRWLATLWREAVDRLDDVAAGIADTDTGDRIPGSLYTHDTAKSGARS